MLHGPEVELRTLSRSNQLMRKAIQQVKEICLSQGDTAEQKLASITALL